jgi:outer membrane protein TolC
MQSCTTTIAGVLLVLAFSAGAQAPAVTNWSVTLDECLHLALRNNLSVQIERRGPVAARLALEGARGAYDPSLVFSNRVGYLDNPGRIDSFTGFTSGASRNRTESYSPGIKGLLPWGATYDLSATFYRDTGTSYASGPQYRDNLGLTLTQPLLRNGPIDSARHVLQLAKKDLKISELVFLARVHHIVAETQMAYYELSYASGNIRVFQASLELAEQFLDETRKKVEVGALAPLEEKLAQSQAATRRAELIAAQRDLEAKENVLKNLLTADFAALSSARLRPADALVALPEPLELQPIWERGLARRPELLQGRLDLERQELSLRYFKNQRLPQLDLAGTYGYSGLGGNLGNSLDDLTHARHPFYSYALVFSYPIGNRAAKADHEAIKVAREKSLLQLKKLEQDVLVEIDDAVKLARADFERVDATRKARQFAEAALEAEQKKLEAGKSTGFVVLQLQRDLATARSSEMRAAADYQKALARVALGEGTVLERNKLAIEIK